MADRYARVQLATGQSNAGLEGWSDHSPRRFAWIPTVVGLADGRVRAGWQNGAATLVDGIAGRGDQRTAALRVSLWLTRHIILRELRPVIGSDVGHCAPPIFMRSWREPAATGSQKSKNPKSIGRTIHGVGRCRLGLDVGRATSSSQGPPIFPPDPTRDARGSYRLLGALHSLSPVPMT